MSIIEKAMGRRGNSRPSEQLSPNVTRKVVRHPASNAGADDIVLPVPNSMSPKTHVSEEPFNSQSTARLKVSDVITSNTPTPQTLEEFRRIKRPLLANAFGRGALAVERGNLIMITSALPDEGKTTVTLNLAQNVALERNNTVLLVDADVAKHEMSKLYKLESNPGLTDVLLEDDLNPNHLVVRSDFPGLYILPAGRRHEHAMELLSSTKMETVVTELIDQHPNRIVILDCPPMLATNEPQVLARLVGQIVVVVEAGRTPHHAVLDAIATLDPSKPINFVLNKGRRSLGGEYYGGYYGYGTYGYGAK